jgi:hypothetical protein
MGLGIKPLYEERRMEFLPDNVYCLKMISEVVEFLPTLYAEPVAEICKANGKEVDLSEIRRVKSGRLHDRFIAYCINSYGKLYIK